MKRNVILTIEYNLGDYSDVESDGNFISRNPKDYEETFFQSDIDLSEMEIVAVRVEDEQDNEGQHESR